MELDRTIELLKESLEELRSDSSIKEFWGTFIAWKNNVRSIIINGLGDRARLLLNQFDVATRGLPMPDTLIDPGHLESTLEDIFKKRLPNVERTLENIIWQLETFGEPYVVSKDEGNIPKAFIAHGTKSEPLDKLCRFLSAVGIQPLVIEEEPSEGRSIDEQVKFYMEQADCGIILGTADDKELKDGKLYPRRNVCIEIGRFQERFPNRIIYLLEEDASLPSNISEKVYARFSRESMDEAFVKAVRELNIFGLITASKIETGK